MTGRERIRAIISGRSADRCGFWLGAPHERSWPLYFRHFGVDTEEEVRERLGDDFRWIRPAACKPLFKSPAQITHAGEGPLARCRSVADLDAAFDWPRPDQLDFGEALQRLRQAGDHYRASGFTVPFFHKLMSLFGMETYLVNLYENPELVHAATDRVCEFYYEANQRFFSEAGDEVDGFFFGNDFGTQRALLVSPEHMQEFVMPWFRRFTEQAHRHGCQVILHSCGSIYGVIEDLIDAGVDCLHPLQARACGMDAETLARDFRGRVAFMGGIDTQHLLVRGNPEEVKADVRRVKQLLGPRLIVSPSHEALLPNVPPENVAAMAEAARTQTENGEMAWNPG
ncbi:hypothetical protein HS125_15340 [bacterium]|nr:hypothetical protein [bacterium]